MENFFVKAAFTFIGAFVLYILNRINNRQPFSFLMAINLPVTASTKPIVIICDMLLSSIIGALVVVPLVNPATIPQCIIAGLGMTGILSSHATEINHATVNQG
jgi:hypothetical protein